MFTWDDSFFQRVLSRKDSPQSSEFCSFFVLLKFFFLCYYSLFLAEILFDSSWRILFLKGNARGRLLITDIHKENCSSNSLFPPKILRLYEMKIFIFSTKELEGLLMRSEVEQLLLKCVLFSNLYTGLWQSLDEAFCEGLIRTWKTVTVSWQA